uniref:Uncharacterized protein n=1 Tax=Helianthus annuus TaxID=4232 RepID=A0A251UCI3_HELAN
MDEIRRVMRQRVRIVKRTSRRENAWERCALKFLGNSSRRMKIKQMHPNRTLKSTLPHLIYFVLGLCKHL